MNPFLDMDVVKTFSTENPISMEFRMATASRVFLLEQPEFGRISCFVRNYTICKETKGDAKAGFCEF